MKGWVRARAEIKFENFENLDVIRLRPDEKESTDYSALSIVLVFMK
jgi:hypothetical protein